ncbi:MAG: mechanosensitive ion channel [Acetobacteraceae bacterium]|nr:mechanosensitive ion channel [Acetobacteraceae bacterium]
MVRLFFVPLLILCLGLPPAAGQSSAPMPSPPPATAGASTPVPSGADTQRVLDILKDERRRAELIVTLETIIAAQGGGLGAVPAGAKPADAATGPLVIPLVPNSLGANLLVSAAGLFDRIETQMQASLTLAQALPGLAGWAWETLENPDQRSWLVSVVWRLALAFAGGWAARWVVLWLLRRPRSRLIARASRARANQPDPGLARAEHGETEAPAPAPRGHPAWRRPTFALGCLVLDGLGLFGFMVGAHVVLATPLGGTRLMQLVILAVSHGYVAWQAVLALSAAATAPQTPDMRLLGISTEAAQHLQRLVRRLSGLVIMGHALARVIWLMGLSLAGLTLVEHAILLLAHLGLAAIILYHRRNVAAWLGNVEEAGSAVAWPARLAPFWHWVALAALAVLWVLLALQPVGGPALVIGCLLGSGVIVVVSHLTDAAARNALDRLGQSEDNQHALHSWLRVAARLIVNILAGLAILELWGLAPVSWLFVSTLGRQMLGGAGIIAITLSIAVIVWEGANLGINRHIARLAGGRQAARAIRLRTLLPMLRTSLLTGILIMVGLTVLSQLGVNIAPLLAGAGVLGIAIGFGSQKLVQDIINGLFLLLENAMQVGDDVTLGGLTGVVEELSVRSIRLRAEDGSVHVIPFSAVSAVTNKTRDFGRAVIEARVANTEDYEKVTIVLREVFKAMRAEPLYESDIVGDLDMVGLARMEDTAMVIKCRVKCTPFARGRILREFQRRMQQQFAALDIAYPPATR